MTNKRTYKKRQKLRTCETCGKDLSISDFFNKGTVCIDCVAAENGGYITCTNCSGDYPVSHYDICNYRSYRKKTCKTCREKGNYTGASATTSNRDKKCVRCGGKYADTFRGEFLCRGCLNADVVTPQQWHANHSNMGSAADMCAEQNMSVDRSRG